MCVNVQFQVDIYFKPSWDNEPDDNFTDSIKRVTFQTCGKQLKRTPEAKGPKPAKPRIINGEIVAVGEYPWTVRIRTDEGTPQAASCTASIINEDWLLTAAHCVYRTKTQNVLLGQSDDEPTKNRPVLGRFSVSKCVMHEDYVVDESEHDIALLKLSQSLNEQEWWNEKYPKVINGICLPPPDAYVRGQMEIAGFGRTENGTSSLILRKGYMNKTTDGSCIRVWLGSALWRSFFLFEFDGFSASRVVCTAPSHQQTTCYVRHNFVDASNSTILIISLNVSLRVIAEGH